MDIETIAIVSGVVFGAGLIVAKYVIGHLIAAKAVQDKAARERADQPAGGQAG